MTHFLRWLRFVGRLLIAYSAVGFVGMVAATMLITAYVHPAIALAFVAGVTGGVATLFIRRSILRARRENQAHPLTTSVRAFISEDGWSHHGNREAA